MTGPLPVHNRCPKAVGDCRHLRRWDVAFMGHMTQSTMTGLMLDQLRIINQAGTQTTLTLFGHRQAEEEEDEEALPPGLLVNQRRLCVNVFEVFIVGCCAVWSALCCDSKTLVRDCCITSNKSGDVPDRSPCMHVSPLSTGPCTPRQQRMCVCRLMLPPTDHDKHARLPGTARRKPDTSTTEPFRWISPNIKKGYHTSTAII